MTEKTYQVPMISCMHCKMTIERVLGKMEGVSKVEVDVDAKSVDVAYDDGVVSEKVILDALADEGYPVAA